MTVVEVERAMGEVFTRCWVVESILDLVGYTIDRDLTQLTLVEPSVGGGAFLVPIVERLLRSAEAHDVAYETLHRAVTGLDLLPEHVAASRSAVEEVLLRHGVPARVSATLVRAWVREGDFLLDDLPTGVDFVVGNPPYVRSDDLDDEVEAAYRARWATMRGRADIYVGFYERSLSLLAPGGQLGFICADRWMRNAYGRALRALISDRYAVQSVWQMHDVDAFESEVSAYPAITVIANASQGPASVIDTTAEFGEVAAREAVSFALGQSIEASGSGWSGARLPSWFETDDFWPAGPPQVVKMLEHLQENFPALEDDGQTRIRIGVATGADKAYIYPIDEVGDVEPDRLLPIVMADDIRSGFMRPPRKVMLNPWDDEGRLIDLVRYPRFSARLGAHEAVRKRFVVRKNPEAWHRTIDKVQPGLAEQPKLLLQDMKAQITPVLEPGGFYPHHNLYYLVSSSWDLEVLGGLLLSRVAEAFVSAYGVKMRGGTLRFQAQYLRKIAVPSPDSIPADVEDELRRAFRDRDRDLATAASLRAYGLPAGTI